MKPKHSILLGLGIISLSVALLAPTSAQASSATMPASLRGYYIGNGSLLWIKRGSVSIGSPQADVYSHHVTQVVRYGNTYKIHTYINMGGHYTQTYTLKKTGYHKLHFSYAGSVHKVTKSNYYFYANNGYERVIKHKTQTSGMKIAKTNGFYFDKYTPAYFQLDHAPQKLYTSSEDAQAKKGKTITVRSIYKKYSARWDDGNKNNILRVHINGTTYFIDTQGEFQPYNSWKDKSFIDSPYSPTSKSKIVLRHGDKYSKIDRWSKDKPIKEGIESLDVWQFVNHKWSKM